MAKSFPKCRIGRMMQLVCCASCGLGDVRIGMHMRIGILGTRGIPANYGGFETFVQNIAPRLVDKGHDVVVYNRPGYGEGSSFYKGVRLKETSMVRNKYLETMSHTFLSLWDATFREDFDVLLMCNVGNSLLLVLPRLKKLPVLLNVDGLEWQRKKWPWLAKKFLLWSERVATKTATAIVTDAYIIQEYYRRRYKAATTMIPYGSNATRTPCQGDHDFLAKLGLRSGNYFLYVSRLEPENNADMVIRAFSKTKDALPGAKLAMVGDAPYAHAYKRKLHALAASDRRVHMLGAIYGEGYEILQRHATVYIQATEVGGTHPALVEGMAFGNCIFALNGPENVEVTGGHALLFNGEDELTKLFLHSGSGQIDCLEWGLRAHEYAAITYSWATISEQYEAILAKIAGIGETEGIHGQDAPSFSEEVSR